MKTTLNLQDVVVILVNNIGGSTLFIILGTITTFTGSAGMSLILPALTMAMNFSLARCAVEVALLLPEAGGLYLYVWRVFGGFFAFMYAWTYSVLLIGPVWGLFSFSTAVYLAQLAFPECRPPTSAVTLLAICILFVVVVVNCCYLKHVTRFQGALTGAKFVGIVIIVMAAIVAWARGDLEDSVGWFGGTHFDAGDIAMGLITSNLLAGGWLAISFLVGEMKDPARVLPRAINISFLVVFVLTELTIASYFIVLTPAEVTSSQATAVIFMEKVFRPLAPVLAVVIVLSSVGSLNGAILSQSRLPLAAAKAGHCPRILATTSQKYKMPWASIATLTVLATLLLVTASLKHMVMILGVISGVCNTALVLCLLGLRWTRPSDPRPVKVWLGTALLQLGLNLAILVLSVYQKPQVAGRAVIVALLAIPLYVYLRWRGKPRVIGLLMDKLLLMSQKLFLLELS